MAVKRAVTESGNIENGDSKKVKLKEEADNKADVEASSLMKLACKKYSTVLTSVANEQVDIEKKTIASSILIHILGFFRQIQKTPMDSIEGVAKRLYLFVSSKKQCILPNECLTVVIRPRSELLEDVNFLYCNQLSFIMSHKSTSDNDLTHNKDSKYQELIAFLKKLVYKFGMEAKDCNKQNEGCENHNLVTSEDAIMPQNSTPHEDLQHHKDPKCKEMVAFLKTVVDEFWIKAEDCNKQNEGFKNHILEFSEDVLNELASIICSCSEKELKALWHNFFR